MGNRVEELKPVAQKDRISVDIADLKQRIESCRDDAAWGELPLTGKVRTLVIERMNYLERAKSGGEVALSSSDAETLQLLIGFLNCLLDTHDRDGYSLSEIAEALGRDDKGASLIALISKLQNGDAAKKGVPQP
ncbi:MAG: hypothetical protein KME07_06475 [Pegethrix bostrychoides GSE-TBD4-15B]|jgi:hypothetical protein|uniref:Uncharacterized protein n=1 Tax=Pegethrix bostrychoides GSE-TBD4-15B TaxID=2839662 RepID=A0A951P9L1_9CYAN|nr:hypothetical protein [Pegethrix bostrychoides GSE-TBD4-15B]